MIDEFDRWKQNIYVHYLISTKLFVNTNLILPIRMLFLLNNEQYLSLNMKSAENVLFLIKL